MQIQHKSLLAISVLGVLFGGFFAIEEWFFHASFATTDAMIWTLPLLSYIFLALASTGVSILYAYGSLKQIASIEKHKLSLLGLALGLLIGAFAALATEMGSPLHLFWLLLSPNFISPIWWMGTLYSIELGLLAVKLLMLLLDKKSPLDIYLTYLTLAVAALAGLVLGSVFGTVIGREGFSGLDASILTLICALSTGVAMILLTQSGDDRHFYISAARWLFALLCLFVTLKWLYLMRAHVAIEPQWLHLTQLLGVLLAWLSVKALPRIAAALLLVCVFSIEFAFVIQGQLAVLGPKTSWFGSVVNYQANLAEMGIFIFSISVAIIAVNIIVQGVPYLQSRR